MQVPWWEDPESYRANSPVHHVQNMNTPLLMAFGNEGRRGGLGSGCRSSTTSRAGPESRWCCSSYEGEDHGFLEREPNQKDYHRAGSSQWFGHYLKGEPAPDWISTGVPYIEQKDRLKPRKPVG